MTNICFIAPWGTPENLLARFKNQTSDSSVEWNSLRGVADPEQADCLVVLDAMGEKGVCKRLNLKNLDKYSIIHLRREPDFINRFYPLPNSGFMDYSPGTFHVATWWISNSYDSLQALSYSPKPKKLSTVVSAKWEHRNSFFKKLSSLIKFDAYGGGGIKSFVGSSYQGPVIPFKNKEDGIKDYKYSIALENSSQLNYFTEKIIDCLLMWTIPIYWGCPNISDFFPQHSFYNIDLDKPQEVLNIIKRPIEKKNIEAMKEARNLILNKYNIWAVIEKLIKGV
jgi:hypothetical protein